MEQTETCLFCGVVGNLHTDFAEPGCCNLCIKSGPKALTKSDPPPRTVGVIPGSGFNGGDWDDE